MQQRTRVRFPAAPLVSRVGEYTLTGPAFSCRDLPACPPPWLDVIHVTFEPLGVNPTRGGGGLE